MAEAQIQQDAVASPDVKTRSRRQDFLKLLTITGSRDIWKFFVEEFAVTRSNGASGARGESHPSNRSSIPILSLRERLIVVWRVALG